ncbi:MAG: HPF/RaiA family ribosome-associated protein [Candidatus Moranbacteria bacterium]|nr:HPF/RaiA family ribosome-associated protein [Candidatus Moranbacteria bacterium]
MKIREYFGEVRLNPEERKYLVKKIEKIKESVLSNYKENEISAELRVSQNKKREWSLEVSFKVPKNVFQASRKGFALTEVMDEVEEVIVRQILRKKEKLQDLRKRGSRSLRKKRTIDGDARF